MRTEKFMNKLKMVEWEKKRLAYSYHRAIQLLRLTDSHVLVKILQKQLREISK